MFTNTSFKYYNWGISQIGNQSVKDFDHMNFKLIQQKITLPLIGALISGVLVAISVPSTSTALAPVGVANTATTSAAGLPTSLNIATLNAGLPTDSSASAIAVSALGTATAAARSIGLVAANLDSATRTATVLPSGVLSLYLFSSTTVAISASQGHLSSFVEGMGTATTTITSSAGAAGAATATTSVAFTNSATAVAGTVAVLYTAPATAGTYYIYARHAVHPGTTGVPTAAEPLLGTDFGGVVVTVTTNTTHPSVGGTNGVDISAAINQSLFTAVASNTGINAVIHPTTTLGVGEADALSKGLLYKDSTVRTAQTATVLAGGTLSLYGVVNTAVAFSASGGTFASSRGMNNTATVTYNSSNQVSVLNGMTPVTGSTAVATLWTAPTTVGSYTVSMLTGFYQTSAGVFEAPTTSTLPATLGAKITVTVVATSGGGSYSAAYSACNTATTSAAASSTYPSGIDSTTSYVADGGGWFIDFNLKDGYQAALDPGNLVATATNGALVNFGATSGLGTAPTAGTASTDVALQSGANTTLIVTQGTAGAPVTTTVTISYNGTTVCTKTVTISGKVASLEIGSVGTGSRNSLAGSPIWIEAAAGGVRPAGLFTVLAKDSAGNRVSTPATLGTYSAVASSLTTVVQDISVVSRSSSISSTSANRFNIGTFYCGDTAGSANVKLKFTTTGTGEVVESPAIAARCADSAYTFTASTDKAEYQLGDLATVTVQFLDSKGNKANSVAAPGASTFTLPMMTAVDYASSATAVTKADGTSVYKFTVGGTNVAVTAGTYTGVISYPGLAASTNATLTYKITTGGDSTSFSDILKSVVALIASINKQIQALQKLILSRRK
jgi:hypothetical protein